MGIFVCISDLFRTKTTFFRDTWFLFFNRPITRWFSIARSPKDSETAELPPHL